MEIQLVYTTSSQIDNLPIVNGQVCVLTDKTAFYYDMGNARHVLTDKSVPELGFGYAMCSTPSGTAAKVASIADYELGVGGLVAIRFSDAVDASSTLNISNKGAKPIYFRGSAITADVIGSGTTALMMYDGTNYNVVGLDSTSASSSIVSLTQAEYDALPSSKESDNVLYLAYFDGSQDAAATRRIYYNGREYAEFNGGGDLSAHELTQDEYDDLTQEEKESETDVYFINDVVKEEIVTPVDVTRWQNTYERSMSISVQNDLLTYSYLGGSYIGAFSIYQVQIPADATKIRFNLTTGTAYSDSIQRFYICVGVKSFNSTTPTPAPDPAYDDTWIKYVSYNTQNSIIEGELDISDVDTACYLYFAAPGWTLTVNEMDIITEQETSETVRKIMYKNAPYADGTGKESWTDIEGTLTAGNTSITLISSDITLDSTLEFFTDVFGVCPTDASVSVGSVTLTFEERASDLGVKVRVTNTGQVLPYTFKNYLEVTEAGAYIDTGVTNTATAYFEVDFQYTGTPTTNDGIFGAMGSGIEFVINSYGGVSYAVADGTRAVFTSTNLDRHVIKADNTGILVDGESSGATVSWSRATGYNYYIFAFNYLGSTIYKTGHAKIYSVKIYNGTDLVRNMVPAIRDADGEIGMYDQVTDTFYTNAGTGSFITA